MLVAASALLASACTDADSISLENFPAGAPINIGGISTEALTVAKPETRTLDDDLNLKETDAEQIDWLLPPLMNGLNITYGNLVTNADGTVSERNKHVAQLKLVTDVSHNIQYSTYEDENGEHRLAKYTFKYIKTEGGVTAGNNAKWYDNGPHFFEGVYVPEQLRQGSVPADLTTNQSGKNYEYLTHYLGMPADCQISATISRIRLPFKHRLSRVLAYVLIDPKMDEDAGRKITIRGYKSTAAEQSSGKDDPNTSDIRFNRVKVLKDVKVEANGGLTPQWSDEVRKVVPHFVGENGGMTSDGVFKQGDFIMYHHKKHDTYHAPSSADYAAATADYAQKGASSAYEQIVYKNAPCYDLIVEPSYSDAAHVMYDEDGYYDSNGAINESKRTEWARTNNKILFEVTLSNGLHYTKEFNFNDLNANYQTVVYLRIQRESIDYDNSGSEEWSKDEGTDGYYGVNNQNPGNILSDAGSSWQRAFHIGTRNEGITDGSHYTENNEEDYHPDKDGQYITVDNWINAFAEAHQGGKHHGDYFILDQDITIDASKLPSDFKFTGHLDGRGHKITLIGTRNTLFDGLFGDYSTSQETNSNVTPWEANVHKEGNYWVPVSGYRAELLNTNFICTKLFPEGYTPTGYIYNCKVNGAKIADHVPTSIPKY